ncbi:conserved hypothetical protein [Ricinus communis]|uniref:PA domain-containing protein n=1 Tax=Ricinus communis TaxID=3988 RepID=B9RYW9_RICCO|nr:conserved hypothetical protein [Ricinus communis]
MGSILLGKKEKYNFGLYDSIYSTVLNGWSNLTVSVNAKSRTTPAKSLSFNNTSVDGKVVLCFIRRAAVSSAASTVRPAGGVGVIVAQDPGDALGPGSDDFSCIAVNYELGTQKLLYICSSKSLSVKTSLSRTLVGNPVATRVVYFSSRGVSPAILKTDIAAIRASMPQPAVVTMDKYVTTCGGKFSLSKLVIKCCSSRSSTLAGVSFFIALIHLCACCHLFGQLFASIIMLVFTVCITVTFPLAMPAKAPLHLQKLKQKSNLENKKKESLYGRASDKGEYYDHK